ncbi:MAG: tetratricopeptide repeat protein [Cyclobacteriaceae bacterium]
MDSLKTELIKTKDKKQHARIALDLSSKLLRTNLSEALEYSNAVIEEAHQLKNDSLLLAGQLNQGNIYLQLGNYARAMQLYQQVLQKKPDPVMVAIAHGNVGSVYYFQRDHKNALRYYLNASKDYSEIKGLSDKRLLLVKANLMNNIGIIYEETKKFDSARIYYSEGLKLGQQLKEHEITANVLNNLGTFYEDQDSLKLALDYYMKALRLRKENNDMFGLARSHHNLGQFYNDRFNQIDSAIENLNKSIDIGTRVGAWQTVGSAADMLYRAYYKKKNYRDALDALAYARQVNDSLFNEENTRKIAQLEMQFEFDKKQAMIEASQKEKELYYWMTGGGLVLMLVIVTLLFFLQRSRTKRSELEQAHLQLEKINLKNDLAIKDKDLAINIMYLLNKNELINHLSEKLLDIKNGASPETQTSIQKVILDLQANLQPELWQEFEFRFQQVHEQFYKVLNERFPDLSPSERRLCAFLKLNMTTKEISAITHQNAKSIDVARTRLRKKLNLTGTDHNLVTFLSQLDEIEA